MFLCCFISIFAKTVDVYCIFNKTIFGHLGHFNKTSDHPRVIFANAMATLYNVCAVPWGVLSTVGVFSTVGDIMSTMGDILSTMGGVQYRGGYHEYCEGLS